MKKRILAAFLLIMLAFSVMVSPAFATRKVLYPTGYVQEKDGWCWAAVDRSIINFYTGATPTQTYLANKYDPDDPNDGALLSECNNALIGEGVRTSLQYNKLTYTGVQSQINSNHLIFARLYQYEILGPYHANLIRGYDTSTSYVLFIDPIDGAGHGQAYDSYCSGYHWDDRHLTWDGSIFDTAKK